MNENTFINSFFFSFYLLLIVCNMVLAPPPLPYLRHPLLHPACPPPLPRFFKSLFPVPSFSVPTPFQVISDSSLHSQATPSSPNPTHQPSVHLINEFKQISKGWFYQINVAFCQKSISNFLNFFTNMSGYLNL